MNTGTYSLKNVKQCNGREGIAWSGTLYDGARKIADVQDDGNGGCLRIWFFDRAGGAIRAHLATLEARERTLQRYAVVRKTPELLQKP